MVQIMICINCKEKEKCEAYKKYPLSGCSDVEENVRLSKEHGEKLKRYFRWRKIRRR